MFKGTKIMEKYVIYFEDLTTDTVERWYYGTYEDRRQANDIAISLGYGYCVTTLEDAIEWGEIKNLPQ